MESKESKILAYKTLKRLTAVWYLLKTLQGFGEIGKGKGYYRDEDISPAKNLCGLCGE